MTRHPCSTRTALRSDDPDGRKIGILVTSGADAGKLAELKSAAEQADVNVELVAPVVGGVEISDGNRVPADQKVDGGPSVLYDAIAVLASEPGARDLAMLPPARDFISDAYAHCKFVGYAGDPSPLFVAAGVGGLMDDGFISLEKHSAADFIARCAELRYWPRAMASGKVPAGART